MKHLLREVGVAILCALLLFSGLLALLWGTELLFVFLPYLIAVVFLPAIGVAQFKLMDYLIQWLPYEKWFLRTWLSGVICIIICVVMSVISIVYYKVANNFNMPNWVFIIFFIFCLLEIPYQIMILSKKVKTNQRVYNDVVQDLWARQELNRRKS